MPKNIHAVALGKKGGLAGRGSPKARSSEHYSRISRMYWSNKKTPNYGDGKSKCSRCGEIKPLELFRKSSAKKSGFTCYCKICSGKYIQESKSKKSSHYIDLQRKFRERHPDTYWIRNKDNPEFISKRKRRVANYTRLNKHKKAAHNMVAKAIKTGRLAKPVICSKCEKNAKRIEGHHPDYSKPL